MSPSKTRQVVASTAAFAPIGEISRRFCVEGVPGDTGSQLTATIYALKNPISCFTKKIYHIP